MVQVRHILICFLLTMFFYAHGQLPCEDCPTVTAESYPQSHTEVRPCFDVEFEYNFTNTEGIIPAHCIEGPICLKIKLAPPCNDGISYFNMFTQEVMVSLEGAGSFSEEYQPSYTETDLCFGMEDLLLDQPVEGYGFSQEPKLTVTIGSIEFEADINILPTGSYMLGDLVETGIVEGPTNYNYFGLRICEGQNPPTIASGSTIEINGGNWTFNGNIEGGLSSGPLSGSVGVGANYNSGSTTESYSILASAPLPGITAEDCEGLDESCKCCGEYMVGFSGLYNEYETISYGCDGEAIGEGQENVLVLSEYLSAEYKLEIQGCPSQKPKLQPSKSFGNDLIASTTGTITVEEELDFDFYTLTWTGPNGFTATNETTLTNLPFGTYCYTLTHCGCDGPVDQGCVALCPDATPVSDWYYEENKELYCRNMSCEEAGEAVQECVDGVPCEDWQYDDQDEECFRDICYEEDILFTEVTEAYDIEYDYNESSEKCEVSIFCESGEASMTIEREPVFSDPFFDEDENTCFRYVICQEEEVAMEEVGIEDIEWSYDQDDGCIGEVKCEEGSHNDAEVKGGDVITEYENWEYDLDEDCFRDVECSLDGDFEDEIREASEGEQEIEWFYDDDHNECFATVYCDDEEVENGVSDDPYFGDWDENEALNDLECIRVAECGDENFVDTEESDLYWEVGDCEYINGEMSKPCWRVVECDNEKFEDEEFWIPCDENCAGYNLKEPDNQSSLNAAPFRTKIQRCGIEFEFSTYSDFLDLKIMPSEQTLSYTAIITHIGTGRLIEKVNGKSNTIFQQRIRLPSKGVYALTLLSEKSRLCNFKIIHL